MTEPPFYLQISDRHGVVVRTHAGGKHEADLIALFLAHIMPKGVGFFKSSSHVEQDIREGIADALASLKIQNPYDVVAGDNPPASPVIPAPADASD